MILTQNKNINALRLASAYKQKQLTIFTINRTKFLLRNTKDKSTNQILLDMNLQILSQLIEIFITLMI